MPRTVRSTACRWCQSVELSSLQISWNILKRHRVLVFLHLSIQEVNTPECPTKTSPALLNEVTPLAALRGLERRKRRMFFWFFVNARWRPSHASASAQMISPSVPPRTSIATAQDRKWDTGEKWWEITKLDVHAVQALQALAKLAKLC